jgi:hypothetical protein
LKVHAGLLIVGGTLLVLAPFAPASVGDASWLERRLPLMAAFMLVAAVAPTFASAAARFALGAVLLGTTVLRVAWIADVWTGRQSDLTQLLAATRDIEPGAAVLTVQQEADWRAAPPGTFIMGSPFVPRLAARHFGSLLVVENHACVPSLFAIPGQHVLKVLPPWRERSLPFQRERSLPFQKVIRQAAGVPRVRPRIARLLASRLRLSVVAQRQSDPEDSSRHPRPSSPATGSLACTASCIGLGGPA